MQSGYVPKQTTVFQFPNYFKQELFSVQSVWNFLFYSLTKVQRKSPLLITFSLPSPCLLSLEADIVNADPTFPPSHCHTLPRPPLLWPSQVAGHTPSIAFRHLSPNSARYSYATEGALFISAQLSSDAVSALRKVRVLT